MKPMIKWSGGKTREIVNFKEFYPEGFARYVEPFVGGGAVFFDLNFEKDNVINDIHPDLINFYNQIKLGNGKAIYDYMENHLNDEEVYYFVRDEFEPKNDIEKAFQFYYLRKTCYRGMLRYNKKGKFNIPFGRYKTMNYSDLLDEDYKKLLERTEIYNTSFEDIFDKYNGEENFFFLDPPYDSVFTDYGYCKYDRENHLQLHEKFINTKSKCLMVIGETEFITELYKDYIKDKFHKKYSFKIHSGRVGNEIDNYHLIITNY
jgi:DNA adenine methylase